MSAWSLSIPLFLCINVISPLKTNLRNERHFFMDGSFQGVSNNAHVINSLVQEEGHMSKEDDQHVRTRFKRSYTAVSTYTAEEKQQILDIHNEKRRAESDASNMNKLIWNEQLASIAQDWAEKCIWDHRNGTNTVDQNHSPFFPVGENLYYNTFNYEAKKPTQVWVDFERAYFSYDTLVCDTGKVCGHYTQVVWGASAEVGCGRHLCTPLGDTGHNAYYSVCNYGPAGNWNGVKPFLKGIPCTECKSGLFLCENNLCTNCTGESGCDCRAYCSNCGTVADDCTCNCVGTYEGSHCQDYNGPKCSGDDPKCGNGWPYNPICTNSQYAQIAKNKCATFCGLCASITEPPCGNQTHADLQALLGGETTTSVTSDDETTASVTSDDETTASATLSTSATTATTSTTTGSTTSTVTTTTPGGVTVSKTFSQGGTTTSSTTLSTTTAPTGGVCPSTTCENGGTATPSGVDSCSCLCADGWSGKTCDENVEELNSGVDVTVSSSAVGKWNILWTTVKVYVNNTVNGLCNSNLYYESCCPQATSTPTVFVPQKSYIDSSSIVLGTAFPKIDKNTTRFMFYVTVNPANDLCSVTSRKKRAVIKMDQSMLYQAVSSAQGDLNSALSECCGAAIVSLQKGSSASENVCKSFYCLLSIIFSFFVL